MIQLKKTKKTNPIIIRRNRAEISETETVQRISKSEDWLLEKMTVGTGLTQLMGREPKLTQSEIKQGNITTNIKEIQNSIGEYFQICIPLSQKI